MTTIAQPSIRPRARRLVLRGAGALVLIVVAVLAWGLFWPAPGSTRPLHCAAKDPAGCRAASGRVVYVPRKDRADSGRPLHLLLLSRDSVALPLVTIVKIPAAMRPRAAPRVGRWVSVVGRPHLGSNGETDIGVTRFVMP